jgi:hypothetical protein
LSQAARFGEFPAVVDPAQLGHAVVVVLPTISYVAIEVFIGQMPWYLKLTIILVAFHLAIIGPDAFLARQHRLNAQRHQLLFPDLLDLLVLCVDAGLSLEGALDRITTEMMKQDRVLGSHLMMMGAEMRAGRSTIDALNSLAERLGFDEAIMLDPSGYVAECTGENIFVVRKDVIYTVPRASILEGITRDSLITIAEDMGYKVMEEPISRDQLYIADEVFVCGTAAEVIGLREIDFRIVGSGKTGPVTRALQKAFDELTSGRHARSEQWFSLVPALDPAAVKA